MHSVDTVRYCSLTQCRSWPPVLEVSPAVITAYFSHLCPSACLVFALLTYNNPPLCPQKHADETIRVPDAQVLYGSELFITGAAICLLQIASWPIRSTNRGGDTATLILRAMFQGAWILTSPPLSAGDGPLLPHRQAHVGEAVTCNGRGCWCDGRRNERRPRAA